MTQIASRSNTKYKEIKKNINSSRNFIFIEGEKNIKEAVDSHVEIIEILIDEKNLNLVKELKLDNKPITFIENDLIADLYTTTKKPSNKNLICAIGKSAFLHPEEFFTSKEEPIIYLNNLQDPTNLGTIARMSIGFNALGVVIDENSINPYNTKVIRSSAGAIFNIPILIVSSQEEFFELAHEKNYSIIATSQNATKTIADISSKKNIFVFGNEGNGLAVETLSKVDHVIRIKHSEKLESLNVAFSAGIILYEMYNRN